jgi:hypothetical protein
MIITLGDRYNLGSFQERLTACQVT